MIWRTIPALASLVILAGCPRQALFVVLPNAEGGGVGAITIEEEKTVTTLDQPYATAESRAGSTAPIAEAQGNISVIFRSAIAAQPILPHHFRLYFILGRPELTPESRAAYRAVFDDTKQRPVYQIEVIGFTDTLGLDEANTGADIVLQKSNNEVPQLIRAVTRLLRKQQQPLKKPTGSQSASKTEKRKAR